MPPCGSGEYPDGWSDQDGATPRSIEWLSIKGLASGWICFIFGPEGVIKGFFDFTGNEI